METLFNGNFVCDSQRLGLVQQKLLTINHSLSTFLFAANHLKSNASADFSMFSENSTYNDLENKQKKSSLTLPTQSRRVTRWRRPAINYSYHTYQ